MIESGEQGNRTLSEAHQVYFAVSAGIEIYFTQIFAGQLNVEYHSHGPSPEKSIEAIRSLLCATAEQHAASGVS